MTVVRSDSESELVAKYRQGAHGDKPVAEEFLERILGG